MAQINFSGITDEQERQLKELKGNATWRDLADAFIANAREADVVTRSSETREDVANLDGALAHVREIALGAFSAGQDRLERLAGKAETERDELEGKLSDTRTQLADARKALSDATAKAKRVDELEARATKAEKERDDALAKAEAERDAALAEAKKAREELTAAKAEAHDSLKVVDALRADAEAGKAAVVQLEAVSGSVEVLKATLEYTRNELDEAKAELRELRSAKAE